MKHIMCSKWFYLAMESVDNAPQELKDDCVIDFGPLIDKEISDKFDSDEGGD